MLTCRSKDDIKSFVQIGLSSLIPLLGEFKCKQQISNKLFNTLHCFLPKTIYGKITSYILEEEYVVNIYIYSQKVEIFLANSEICFTFDYNCPWHKRCNCSTPHWYPADKESIFHPCDIKFMSYCMYSLLDVNDCLGIHHFGNEYVEFDMKIRLVRMLYTYNAEILRRVIPMFVLFYDMLVLKK